MRGITEKTIKLESVPTSLNQLGVPYTALEDYQTLSPLFKLPLKLKNCQVTDTEWTPADAIQQEP